MRMRTVAIGAASVVLLVNAGTASASPSLSGPGAIRITDRLVKHLHVDGGVHGHGAGDVDFYRWLLLTKGASPKPIGHSDLTCINTGTGSENCSGTYFLPRGKIMVAGVIASRFIYQLAVIGGTALYDNARGTLIATYLGGNPPREFLLFRLVV
jgi:hypothetical protein